MKCVCILINHKFIISFSLSRDYLWLCNKPPQKTLAWDSISYIFAQEFTTWAGLLRKDLSLLYMCQLVWLKQAGRIQLHMFHSHAWPLGVGCGLATQLGCSLGTSVPEIQDTKTGSFQSLPVWYSIISVISSCLAMMSQMLPRVKERRNRTLLVKEHGHLYTTTLWTQSLKPDTETSPLIVSSLFLILFSTIQPRNTQLTLKPPVLELHEVFSIGTYYSYRLAVTWLAVGWIYRCGAMYVVMCVCGGWSVQWHSDLELHGGSMPLNSYIVQGSTVLFITYNL